MPEEQQPQAGQQQTDPPPWGEDFDPEKAWNLVQGLRADKERLAAREVLTPEHKQQLSEWETLKRNSQTEAERLQGDVDRWQTEAQRWRGNAVTSRVQALAADFADPTDATAALSDPGKYLGADGLINDEAIKADLAQVLEQKPHWRRPSEGGTRPPAPNRSQGALGSTTTDPGQQFAAVINQALSRG